MQPANQLLNSLLHQLSALEGTTIPDQKLAEILNISPSSLSRYRAGVLPLDQIEMLMRVLAQLPSERWNLELEYILNKRVRTDAPSLAQSLGAVKGNQDFPVRLGPMRFSESALCSNILVTGTIGSGKTSSVLYPILRQICAQYNSNTADETDPNQKWGGLVLDVKQEFYETVMYFMKASGRNPLYDLLLVTPEVDYTLVKFLDPETGRHWYVSADGGSEGREIDLITKGYFINGSGIPSTIFTGDEEYRSSYEPALKELTFKVKDNIFFVGWRKVDSELVAISHTDEAGVVQHLRTSDGKSIKVAPPEKLKYVGVEKINRGIRYNICSPHLPAAEAASRLISIAENLSGGSSDQFWIDSAKKLITFIITLWRNLHQTPCSAVEIVRLAVQKSALEEQLSLLTGVIEGLGESILTTEDTYTRKELDGKKKLLLDVERYFTEEWLKLDKTTKGIIVSVISNLFGPFITDSKLQEVFCGSTTFDFEDTLQKGRVVALLTGGAYETLARQLGTALKMDFQATVKSRTTQAPLNKKRIMLHLSDEAQVTITSGGGNNTGDENFMALSRQAKVINLLATQSESSITAVIGEKKAPVYFQSFGSRIWLHNTDAITNQNASRILGKDEEESERFKAEIFSQLNIFDAVIYNKDKAGIKDKACKYKGEPDALGKTGSADNLDRSITVRWYYQAIVENRLHALAHTLLP